MRNGRPSRRPASIKKAPAVRRGLSPDCISSQDAQSRGTAARRHAGWSTALFARCECFERLGQHSSPFCPPRLTERRIDGCRPVLRYANRVFADVSRTTACRSGSSLPPRLGRVVVLPAVHYPAARKPLCSGLHIWISSLSFHSPFCAPCAGSRTTGWTAGAAFPARRRY